MFICDLREGQGVMIGGAAFTISRIPGDGTALVRFGDSAEFFVFADRKTQIAPGVLVYSAAKGLNKVQLHIAAPETVTLRLIKNDTSSGRDRHPDSRSTG